MNKQRVIIVGGGFGGLNLLKKLDQRKYDVLLLDRNNYHTFLPLLYQVAGGGLEPDSIAYPLRSILRGKKDYRFRLAEVLKIDTDGKRVLTDVGDFEYDQLIIATGSMNNFFGNEEIKRHALPLKSLTESLDIRSYILQVFEEALSYPDRQPELLQFVVVGAGPTGVEMAGALAELRRHVIPHDYRELMHEKIRIIVLEGSERILGSFSEESSLYAENYLKKLGVEIFTNTRLSGYDGRVCTLSDGSTIISRTVIWSAGVKAAVPGGFQAAGRAGRVITDEYHRAEGHPNVFIIGDAAECPEKDYTGGHPMLAPVAIQQALNLAKNLNRGTDPSTWKAFRYKNRGTMATIGRLKAVVELPSFRFTGAFAWLVWMALHLMSLAGFRNRIVVFINWLWNYIRYDRSVRLIVRPFKRKG